MDLEEFPKGSNYREQIDIVKEIFNCFKCKRHFLLSDASKLHCSHIERLLARKIAGPCLKAFQGYLPPWETKNTTETIFIQTDAAYQDQLELGLGLSQSTKRKPAFLS